MDNKIRKRDILDCRRLVVSVIYPNNTKKLHCFIMSGKCPDSAKSQVIATVQEYCQVLANTHTFSVIMLYCFM